MTNNSAPSPSPSPPATPTTTTTPRPPFAPGYTRQSLAVLNLLQHPVWIFDAQRTRMFWANTAALQLWNADSLQELLNRDYASDMTVATRQRIDGLLTQLVAGDIVQEQWTYYPRGVPKTVQVTASCVWIQDDDNDDNDDDSASPRPAILDEAENLVDHQAQFQASATRDIELLRHVPIAVSQFDLKGNLLYQNPRDIHTFGCGTTTSGNGCDSADSGDPPSSHSCNFVNRFVDQALGKSVLERVAQGQEINVQAEHFVVCTNNKNDEDDDEDDGCSTEPTPAAAARDGALVGQPPKSTAKQQQPRHFAVSVRRTKDPSRQATSSNNNNNNSSSGDDHDGDGDDKDQYVVLYTARDVTEIVQARKDQDRVKLKSEFLSVIAHELRTPLHQVVGYADLLELTELTNHQLESVKLIQQSTESLMVIINDLLDYNRIESGQLSIDQIHFGLAGVLEGCVATVEAETAVRNLYLHTDFQPPHHVLVGDPNRIRQIMLNLLQNAVKFTEMGGITFTASVVEASSESNDGKNVVWVRFQVIDTGIGIEPEHQQIIFHKFQQANSSISRKYGGTGLGLSICRSLSEAMGGSIELQSTAGQGTTFTVEIPFTLAPTKPTATTVRANGCTSTTVHDSAVPYLTKSLKILVAEDNKVNQKMVRRMLEQLGHSVQVAENGQVALDVLSSASAASSPINGTHCNSSIPDLVLMDIQMPIMDGMEATRLVRGLLHLSKTDLPVVGLTASFQTADLQRYLDVGMNTCLSKPIRLESLKRTLESVVSVA